MVRDLQALCAELAPERSFSNEVSGPGAHLREGGDLFLTISWRRGAFVPKARRSCAAYTPRVGASTGVLRLASRCVAC